MSEKVVLRRSQEEVLKYRAGLMGVAAVPGSGKTFTLSHLAVKLIMSTPLESDQEILVVTFSNSAADNFSTRIGNRLRENGLMEGFGYRVRTLHGLANDIIHERPELVGLPSEFGIIDEAESNEILKDLVSQVMETNRDFLMELLDEDLSEKKRTEIFRTKLPDLLTKLAIQFIKTVKDRRIDLDGFEDWLETSAMPEILRICLSIYRGYQAALSYRGAIDFDDLILYAHQCLTLDPQLTEQLRHRWPIILEDEAQDSSKLQQAILELLVGDNGNWVRVGDPNQAIYESFTTADPNLLKRFVSREDVLSADLPVSGRSSRKIIMLANHLIDWVRSDHPGICGSGRFDEPFIEPTPPGDPQKNPPDSESQVELITQAMTADQELVYLAGSLRNWLAENPDSTVAVLSFINNRASIIMEYLKQKQIPVSDALMKVPGETRNSAGAIALLMRSVLDPTRPDYLAKSFEVFHRNLADSPDSADLVSATAKMIRSIPHTENYLYPQGTNWKEAFVEFEPSDLQLELLGSFRKVFTRWNQASILPIDQLMLVIGQDLALESSEIAILHKLAVFVNSLSKNNPAWTRLDIRKQLIEIANNKRGFLNFGQNEDGFNPDHYRGKVIVATTHKSKGLEWDKVYLTSANNYDFPGGEPGDSYTSEKYFIKNSRNLEAELLYDLEAWQTEKIGGIMLRQYDKQSAREDVVRDRLRLFYVGLTRAKKSLTITWNTGSYGRQKACLALKELAEFQKSGGFID